MADNYPEVVDPSKPQVYTQSHEVRPHSGFTSDADLAIAPAMPAPPVHTQTTSSKMFENSLAQTKQSLSPSGVHPLDVACSPGYDPETQRQQIHYQDANGQYNRPQVPGSTYAHYDPSPPSYPGGGGVMLDRPTYTISPEAGTKKSNFWDRLIRLSKSNIGAAWYCLSCIMAVALCIIVLIGCTSPAVSVFGTNALAIKRTKWSSYSGDPLPYDTSYTAVNPSTGRQEVPNFIIFGFSGYCHLFEAGRVNSNRDIFVKSCVRQFAAPLFIPPPTLNSSSSDKDYISIIDVSTANIVRKVVVALIFINMFYCIGTFIATCCGHWNRRDIPSERAFWATGRH
ncbi:hypothetical protein ABW20_dc0108564 [Dactylellina cionopaga]|nr:hypothetical protein ABW20_dc0108564 [Dactylellina cionopaga]